MSNHYQIELEQHPIELYKLLKIANLVSGGGEAKVLISNGNVILNGALETQKRKKVYSGDIIEFNGDLVELICDAEPMETVTRQLKTEVNNRNNLNKKSERNRTHNKKQKAAPSKRKESSPHSSIDSNINNGQRRKINFD